MWFFSKEPLGQTFVAFGPLHLTIMGVLVIGIALTVIFQARLRAHPKVRRYLPIWLGSVAWGMEIIFHWWSTWICGHNFWAELVPLELCYVSLLLTVVLCFTRSKAVFEIFYFTSFGALLSVIFADHGGFMPDHFRFWHYFFIHSYIVWVNAWFLSVERYKLRRDAFWRLLAFMIPLAAIAKIANMKFSLNYMFLTRPPDTGTPLDYLGQGWAYFFEYVAIAIAVFFIMYLFAPKEPKKQMVAPPMVDGDEVGDT